MSLARSVFLKQRLQRVMVVVVLVLLDLSALFSTIDHTILLKKMVKHLWFKMYIKIVFSDCKYIV